MPGVIFLSDTEARAYSSVPDDPDCDELLQEMRRVTGRGWLVRVDRWSERYGFFRNKYRNLESYSLLLDCHGEYQLMNLVPPRERVPYVRDPNSRGAVMNYMLGYLAAVT